MRAVFALVLAAAFLAGCGGDAMAEPNGVTVTYIQPPYSNSQVSWVGEWLVFDERRSTEAAVNFAHYRLWRVRPDGSEMQKLEIEAAQRICGDSPFFGFSDPLGFHEGTMLFVETCAVEDPRKPGTPSTSQIAAIRAFDLAANAIVPTVYAVLENVPQFQVTGVAASREQSWIMTVDYRLNSPAVRELLAADGKRSGGVRIGQFDPAPARTWALSMSSDGSRIAYAGNSKDGNAPHSVVDGQLYVANSDFSAARAIGGPIYSLYGSSWSPDGRWILIAGLRTGTRGLWLVDVESAGMRFAAEGWFIINPSAWSPDGTRVAVTRVSGETKGVPTVIAVFHLAAMLEEP